MTIAYFPAASLCLLYGQVLAMQNNKFCYLAVTLGLWFAYRGMCHFGHHKR